MTWLRARLLASRDDRGSIAPAVPILAFVLLLLGGLGIDGSRQLNARGEAVAYAEEAARAGAQGVLISADDLRLDEPLVRERVQEYCDRVTHLPSTPVKDCYLVDIEPVSNTDPRMLIVKTHVDTTIDTALLSMVGVTTLSASADAKARPFEGITQPDQNIPAPGASFNPIVPGSPGSPAAPGSPAPSGAASSTGAP